MLTKRLWVSAMYISIWNTSIWLNHFKNSLKFRDRKHPTVWKGIGFCFWYIFVWRCINFLNNGTLNDSVFSDSINCADSFKLSVLSFLTFLSFYLEYFLPYLLFDADSMNMWGHVKPVNCFQKNTYLFHRRWTQCQLSNLYKGRLYSKIMQQTLLNYFASSEFVTLLRKI